MEECNYSPANLIINILKQKISTHRAGESSQNLTERKQELDRKPPQVSVVPMVTEKKTQSPPRAAKTSEAASDLKQSILPAQPPADMSLKQTPAPTTAPKKLEEPMVTKTERSHPDSLHDVKPIQLSGRSPAEDPNQDQEEEDPFEQFERQERERKQTNKKPDQSGILSLRGKESSHKPHDSKSQEKPTKPSASGTGIKEKPPTIAKAAPEPKAATEVNKPKPGAATKPVIEAGKPPKSKFNDDDFGDFDDFPAAPAKPTPEPIKPAQTAAKADNDRKPANPAPQKEEIDDFFGDDFTPERGVPPKQPSTTATAAVTGGQKASGATSEVQRTADRPQTHQQPAVHTPVAVPVPVGEDDSDDDPAALQKMEATGRSITGFAGFKAAQKPKGPADRSSHTQGKPEPKQQPKGALADLDFDDDEF